MFKELVSFQEAKQTLNKHFSPRPVGTETVELLNACNRVLAKDIIAPIDVPPFSRATVDGYAVKAEDTFGAEEDKPVSLRICGRINVGEQPKIKVEKGTAAEIATGAPVPEGADAVVMLEYTGRKENLLYVYNSITKGENVLKVGSDIRKGDTVLKLGQVLGPSQIGVLAALGFKEIEVYKRPKVAIISTGAEITEPGKPLSPGKIYDINAYTLNAAVQECGGEPKFIGVVPDEPSLIENSLKSALNSADLVITSGGVSVGPKDFLPKTLNKLGDPGIIVCGIAVKPGKPTTIAIINGKPVFSLPGHPTSSLMMFHLLVRPIIMRMAGRQEESAYFTEAIAATKMFSAKGRRTFVMVNLLRDKSGKLYVKPVPSGESGAITTMTRADGFVEITETQQFINSGEKILVHLFKKLG
ncbi:MAG: molybdopterin-binding protein [Candidatus Bathyarchaeia archaeon]